MKLYSFSFLFALSVQVKADPATEKPCLAKCEEVNSETECTFIVRRDVFASELGYYTFEGENGDCGGTNPTIGIQKGVTYRFIQKDPTNYYHPIGFAYFPDGALSNSDELEPSISGPGNDNSCGEDLTCPAPMYLKNGEYLGTYSNNQQIATPITRNEEDFGLDNYEPEFFFPFPSWLEVDEYQVTLKYDNGDFNGDFFYFCHIHQFMSGRVKFVDNNGDPTNVSNSPPLGYEYDIPSDYDKSCGTFGLEDFQLPNSQCPKEFVCDQPEGSTGKFASCLDSMNCAMVVGMTTNVNKNDAVALFNHQMIPHHQNAVNMCKALEKSGAVACDDLSNEEDPKCLTAALCFEIINGQNFQIQTMRGILELLGADEEDDCVVPIHDFKKASKKKKKHKS